MAQQAPMVVGQQRPALMLLTGTPVRLRLRQAMTTEGKNLRVGQRFDLETTDAISLNGVTVIPVGSYAVGEITNVRNKGMWGKSGKIEGRFLYVRANNRQIRLTGNLDDKGRKGGWGAAGASVATLPLLPVAGFFITGTSAKLNPGMEFTAYLDEDMPIIFEANAQSAPMVISTGQPK